MPAKYIKRADGRYSTHVTIGVKEDGKPLRKTIYSKTIKGLEEKIAELRRQSAMGAVVTDSSVSLAEWAYEWLETYKNNVSYSTQEMYKIMIKAHIIPNLGHLKLKDIRTHHIQKVVNNKYSINQSRTAEKILLTLKQIFKRAIDSNLLATNPAQAIEMPKHAKPKKRALTDEERMFITTAPINLKGKAFILTLLYAGLRKGEALALSINDIDIENKSITVNKNLITKGNQPEIKMSPKSKAGNRTIPIPDTLVNVLKNYLPEIDSAYVFPSAKNKLMSKISFRRFWDKIISELSSETDEKEHPFKLAPDITPHIFRHTYSTMLFYSGVDIKTAQYLLGHSSINMTMEIYTHLDTSKNFTAATKLEAFISECSQNVVNFN